MLKRYVLYSDQETVTTVFKSVRNEEISTKSHFNIGLGSSTPIVISGLNREHYLTIGTWDSSFFNLPHHQTSITSQAIRSSSDLIKLFQRKRCIIPMNGYYDWKKITESVQIPFYFRILNQDVFGVAGLYDTKEDGGVSFIPIETKANEIVEPLSETMPAILSIDMFDKWLDPLYPKPELLHEILSPHKTIEMSSYRVTLKESDITSNSKDLIQPVV